MYTVTLKDNGKFVGQVRTTNDIDTTHYETPEYITREMATADAKCWIAFHGNKETNMEEQDHTVNANDRVFYRNTRMTGEKFANLITDWNNKYAGKMEIHIAPKPYGFDMLIKCTPTTPRRLFQIYKSK